MIFLYNTQYELSNLYLILSFPFYLVPIYSTIPNAKNSLFSPNFETYKMLNNTTKKTPKKSFVQWIVIYHFFKDALFSI